MQRFFISHFLLTIIVLLAGLALSAPGMANPALAEPQKQIKQQIAQFGGLQNKVRRRFRRLNRKPRRKRRGKNRASSVWDKQAQPGLPVRNPRRHLQMRQTVKVTEQRRDKKKAPPPLIAPPEIPPVTITPKRPPAAFAPPAAPPVPVKKPHRHPSKVNEGEWSREVVAAALDECTRLGVTLPLLPPFKKGRCGNPAAVQLKRLGNTLVRPGATLSCPMVASLENWFNRSVQVEAQKHLGHKVTAIGNVSSYVCRNRYGDTKTRISEHAYANALDIAVFELEGGGKITIKGDWQSETEERRAFLHAIHKSACTYFGTVLGPEANVAHHDHFHLDMAPRKRSNYCR